MARTAWDVLPCRRNSKLDSFLKRNTDRGVYQRIRAYEPCVVVSQKMNKIFMYAVLSDESVYLTEFPPRTLQVAFCFRDVTDIALVNDVPDFLSGRERELSQHIRVVHSAAKHYGKRDAGHRGGNGWPHLAIFPLPQKHQSVSPHAGFRTVRSASSEVVSWKHASLFMREDGEEQKRKHRHSVPVLQSLQLPLPKPLPLLPHGSSPPSPRAPSCICSLAHSARGRLDGDADMAKLTKKTVVQGDGEKEDTERLELHLYAVSPSSRIYLHLQSAWTSYMIRSTLLLDPQFRKRCSVSSAPQSQQHTSWERTAHLFGQLSHELLQQDFTLETFYLLLQELHTAAHRNTAIRRLFWRSDDLCPFLVRTLEDTLHGCCKTAGGSNRIHSEDRLLLSTLLAQTLGLMFRETDIEPARLNLLTAKRGALTEQLLLVLVCDPGMGLWGPAPEPGWESQPDKLKTLLAEYLDAASVLLFEVVLLAQQAIRTSGHERFLTVGWVLKTLWSHQSVMPFISYVAQQVVLVLAQPVLSPAQTVLLYQRCWILLACLRYSTDLACHIRTEYWEEFRYSVKMTWVEDKLPPHYPISQLTSRLLSQLLHQVLRWP